MSRARRAGRHARILGECLRVAFSNATAYRANFLMSAIIVFLSNALFPLIAILIYGSGAGFPGWSFYQVLLIQSFFTLSSGISGMFFRGIFWQTNFAVREGTFEVSLLKPVGTLFWMAVSSIQLESVGMVAGGAAMAVLSLARSGGAGPAGAAAGLLFFCGGVLVMLGINLLMAGLSFKWVGNSRMPEIFDSILEFAKYPQSVVPAAARAAAAFVFPCAMVGFFPAQALLGRTEPWHFLALVPCLAFAAAGAFFYKAMVRRYESVGG